jgi:aldose 1-epimerase
VVDNKIEAKGKIYESGQHGFARLMEHEFVDQTEDTIVLELCSSPETYAKFPYEFRLVSTFTLENDTLHHTLTVENLDEAQLPFGIGYHPAFAIPFDAQHVATDYELRFSEMESPICLNCLPTGLVQKDHYYLGSNITSIAVDEKLFANDSHCMANLQSSTLGIYEKGTGRGVVCNIEQFPYTLIWSKPGMPKFVCIEPWHSLPSPEGGRIKWDEKPAAAILESGEAWSATLSTSFVR